MRFPAVVDKNDHECKRTVPSILHFTFKQQYRGGTHFYLHSCCGEGAGNAATWSHPSFICSVEPLAPATDRQAAKEIKNTVAEIQYQDHFIRSVPTANYQDPFVFQAENVHLGFAEILQSGQRPAQAQ